MKAGAQQEATRSWGSQHGTAGGGGGGGGGGGDLCAHVASRSASVDVYRGNL